MRRKPTPYLIAEHVRIEPLSGRPQEAEKVIAFDPGELFTGVAVWDIPSNQKTTFTLTAADFDEMLRKVIDYLKESVTEKTYIVCEMTFIQHPSATFIWQLIGLIRYFYRDRLCAVPPSQANKGAYGYGRPKLSEKKKILKGRGWQGLKTDHEVSAATLVEFFRARFLRKNALF